MLTIIYLLSVPLILYQILYHVKDNILNFKFNNQF